MRFHRRHHIFCNMSARALVCQAYTAESCRKFRGMKIAETLLGVTAGLKHTSREPFAIATALLPSWVLLAQQIVLAQQRSV